MIILHLAAIESRLFLWGEISSNGDGNRVAPPAAARGQGRAGSWYPYDAGPSELTWVLKDTPLVLTRVVGDQRDLTAWLPTRGKHPIPSSPMIDDPPGSRAKIRLQPWTVSGFMLELPDAVDLISTCLGRRIIASGIVVGQDLAYWGDALRLAGAMTARQQYLPDIKIIDGKYLSFWRPVHGDMERNTLAGLARRMPPVARALTELEGDSPPETSGLDILKLHTGLMLDNLVRNSFKTALAPRVKKRPTGSVEVFDSPHEAWLAALTSENPAIKGDPGELDELTARVREWSRPLLVSATSPFRLCLRLEEPENGEPSSGNRKWTIDDPEDHKWRVRYLLQPRNDPSLQIPLEKIWDPDGRTLRATEKQSGDVREYALTALGQAAGICPRIKDSLNTSAPIGYELDANGAYQFLTEKALALEQAGFGVMLPAWWVGKGARLKPKARVTMKNPSMTGPRRLSLDTVIEFDWRVSLGGETITPRELRDLVILKSPLVRIRGQWVELKVEDIRTALEAWKKNRQGQTTVREAIQMSLGAKAPAGDIELDEVTAEGRFGELLDQLEGHRSFREEQTPAAFSGTLRPYQVRGFSWLCFLRQWGLGACLADDMGLGKTIQTLALVERDRAAGEDRPVLLICPTSVVNNWYKEAQRFTPEISVWVHHGANRLKGAAFKRAAKKHHLVISTYGLLQREVRTLKTVTWAGLVLDEAQNIKNPETKQAKAARAVPADYRIALTGTPVENHVGDLWSIMEFLNNGFLGSQAEFRRRFYVPIQSGSDPEAADALKRITGPFVLRRVKTDKSIISDLPDKIEMKAYCRLTAEQASLYASVVDEVERSLTESEGIQRKGLILATLSKLKQVCNHPAHFLGDNSTTHGRSGKLARLTEKLDEILELGEHALVFSQFKEMGSILKRYLQETYGREALFLHGGTSKSKRDRMVERFQNDSDAPPIFILSLKAGGTGLNLTRANHVFHFDRWWNPAVENQATDRVFRIGQKKKVQVHKMICQGTLEERIDEMIESKREVAEKVVGSGEGWLTELSNSELKDLLTLRLDAVEE